MSIKPITNDVSSVDNKSLNMYANSWSGNTITSKNLLVETNNNNFINYSTPDLGQNNYSLHTDGLGSVYWSPDATTGGDVLYTGTTPITIGTISKFNDVNGLSISNSVMVETPTELKLASLRCTNASNPIDPQDLTTKNYVDTTINNVGYKSNITTGVISGGIITLTGLPDTASTFNVSDGNGTINNLGVITNVIWTGLNNRSRQTDPIAPSNYNGIITYLSINSLGNLIYSDTEPTNQQNRENIFLGGIVHITSITNPTGQLLSTIDNKQTPSLNIGNQLKDLMDSLGFINVSGNLLSASILLTFKKSLGYLMGNGINFFNNPKNPHLLLLNAIDTNIGTGINVFQYRMLDGSSSSSNLTSIIPNKLDDGLPYNTNATFPLGQYGASRVYIFSSEAIIKIQPPQFHYNTIDNTIDKISTENFITEPSIVSNGLLIGYIITKGSTTDLNDSNDARFVASGKFGSGSTSIYSGTQNLQSVYDNSAPPQIITSVSSGNQLTIRRGTALDTDSVLEIENGSGNDVINLKGDGSISIGLVGNNYTLPNTRGLINQVLKTNGSGIVSWSNDDNSGGTVTSISAGTGLIGGVITSSGSLSLSNTGVTPASYVHTSLTVDAQGRITSASNGSAVTSLTNVGANTLINDSNGVLKGLSTGTGISFGITPNDIIINSNAVNALTNAGTTSLISAPNGSLKGLVAGSNITFSTSATDITINSTGNGGNSIWEIIPFVLANLLPVANSDSLYMNVRAPFSKTISHFGIQIGAGTDNYRVAIYTGTGVTAILKAQSVSTTLSIGVHYIPLIAEVGQNLNITAETNYVVAVSIDGTIGRINCFTGLSDINIGWINPNDVVPPPGFPVNPQTQTATTTRFCCILY